MCLKVEYNNDLLKEKIFLYSLITEGTKEIIHGVSMSKRPNEVYCACAIEMVG